MVTGNEAKRIIKNILIRGKIVFKGHPVKRAIERRFSMQDVMWVLSGGSLIENPKKHKLGFECAMRGYTLDRRILKVPIIVNEQHEYIIIKTVIPQRKKK